MWFKAILGFKINLDNCEILPMERVKDIKDLALKLGYRVWTFPSSYLRLPLGAPHKSMAVWDRVEKRFQKRLAMWKRRFISKRKRITPIRSTLSSMSIYSMSLLHMTRVVRLRLEKIQRNFLCGGRLERKPHFVKWVIVCLDKRNGDLGVRCLSKLKRALLRK